MAKASKKTAKKSGKKLKLDFTNVEAGNKCADGQYLVTVEAVSTETSDNSGEDYLKFKLKTEEGVMLYVNTSLQPQALWKLRNLLEAAGMEIPKKALDLDLEELEGLELGVIVENETYQGKKRPQVMDFIPVGEIGEEEGEEEEEEEEEEKPKKKSSKKAPAKKSSKKSKKDEDEKEEEEEEESEEEEEEEEEEKPKKSKGKAAKKAAGKKSKGTIEVGSSVTFTDDGDDYEGEVTKIKKGVATVDVDGDEWEIELDELTLA